MGQTGGLRSPSSDGSDDGSDGSVVYPSPVVPSSEGSPELGFQPSASTPHVSGFNEDPPGMVSSSGSESDDDFDEEQNTRARRKAQASSDARAAAVRARRNIRRGFADDFDEEIVSRAFASRQASGAEFMVLMIVTILRRRSADMKIHQMTKSWIQTMRKRQIRCKRHRAHFERSRLNGEKSKCTRGVRWMI